jgi:hypothetical protein
MKHETKRGSNAGYAGDDECEIRRAMQKRPARLNEAATEHASQAVHRTRRSIFQSEAAWRLGEDALERVAEGRPAFRIPYAEIVELQLSYDPTRFETTRYRCDVLSQRNGRALIVSVSYLSPMNFENRGATYVPFMEALVARVAAANPACRFQAGKRLSTYIGEQLFLLAMLLLLVSVLYLTGAPIAGIVAIKLALLAFFVPTMILYVRKNRPRTFDPSEIPDDILPAPRAPV